MSDAHPAPAPEPAPALRRAVAAVPPRDAASVLLLRDGPAGLEVLMVRRSPHASFMPGAYVFPGGAVDPADGGDHARAACDAASGPVLQLIAGQLGVHGRALPFAVAALRECLEECGLWLDTAHAPAALQALRAQLHAGATLADLAAGAGMTLPVSGLQPWARWVTPVGLPRRFDTAFFLAAAPAGQQPSVDEGETTTLAWVHPPHALQPAPGSSDGGYPMEFATRALMRSLLPHADLGTAQLLAHARTLAPQPAVHPRLRLDADGHIVGVMLPGDAGYADAVGDG